MGRRGPAHCPGRRQPMSRMRSFALAVPALLAGGRARPRRPARLLLAALRRPAEHLPLPVGRDFVSPANRTHLALLRPAAVVLLRPSNPEPYIEPRYPPPPGSSPAGVGSPLDLPLVPAQVLREPETPGPGTPRRSRCACRPGGNLVQRGEDHADGGGAPVRTPPLEPGTRYAYDVEGALDRGRQGGGAHAARARHRRHRKEVTFRK